MTSDNLLVGPQSVDLVIKHLCSIHVDHLLPLLS